MVAGCDDLWLIIQEPGQDALGPLRVPDHVILLLITAEPHLFCRHVAGGVRDDASTV